MWTKRINKILILAVLVGAGGSGAIADSYTSVSNGYWDESSTWSPAGVPGTADVATVDHIVTIRTNVTVGTGGGTNAIVINSEGHLRHETSGYTLIANGNIQVYSNGTLTWGPGTTTKVDCASDNQHILKVNTGATLNGSGTSSESRDCFFGKVNKLTYISFEDESHGTLRYCTLQGGWTGWAAGVQIFGSSPTIVHCDFVEGRGGLFVHGYPGGDANPTITNCVFKTSDYGFKVYSVNQLGTFKNLRFESGGVWLESYIEGENWEFVGSGGVWGGNSGNRRLKLKNSNPPYFGIDTRSCGTNITWVVSQSHNGVPGQTYIWGDYGIEQGLGAGATSKWNYADESYSGAVDANTQKRIYLKDPGTGSGDYTNYYAHTKITAGSGETLEAKGAIGAPTIIDGGSFIFAETGTVTLNRAVCKNSLEGGLKNDGGTIDANNVTLYNNTTGITHIAGTTTLKNSIIWGGTNSVSGSPTITYSDIQGGYTGLGNIDADPLFVDTSTNDFRLQAMSPCRNAGDPSDPAPPGGGSRIDIGAYEYPEPKGTQISIF